MPAKTVIYHGIPIERCDGQLFSDDEVALAEQEEKQRITASEYQRRYLITVGNHINPILDSVKWVPSDGRHTVAVVTKLPDTEWKHV